MANGGLEVVHSRDGKVVISSALGVAEMRQEVWEELVHMVRRGELDWTLENGADGDS